MPDFDPWDVKQIEAQAPDEKSIPAARQVLKKGGFERIESRADGTGWWAVCRGLTDVYNVTATRGPTGTIQSGCTCPSPKRPCKHALALLLHLAAHPELRPELKAAAAPTAEQMEGLIAAVFASPDDDLPRLVFADWLEENGEADRAALIRVSCELAKKRLPAERKKALQAEEKRLTNAALGDVLKLLPRGATYKFRRGFLWLTLSNLLLGEPGSQPASLLRLFQTGGVESITLPAGWYPQSDIGIARFVRRLDLSDGFATTDDLVNLATNLRPGLEGVRLREVIVPVDDRAEYKKLLAGGGPPLSELKNPTAARIRELAAERRFRTAYSLTVTGGDDEALTALAEVSDIRSLAILELRDTAATAAGLIALGNSKHLRKLASLGIGGGRLIDADLEAVGQEAAFPGLHRLALNRLHLTDAALLALARGPAFARIDDYTLDDLPVTPAGLRRFVADAPALECLGVGDLPTSSLLPLVFTRGTRRVQVDSSEASITWEPAERTLSVDFADDVPAGFFATAAEWPKGVRVDRIEFGSTFAHAAFAELLDFLALGRIPRVDLSGLGLRNADAVALADRLPELGITHLDLSENKIGMTGAKALANSPGLATVVSLDLRGNPILRSGRAALAASPFKTELKEINLGGERVDKAETKELRKAFGKGVKVTAWT